MRRRGDESGARAGCSGVWAALCVRLRFLALLLALVAVAGRWSPAERRMGGLLHGRDPAASKLDEYFCPMHAAVVRDTTGPTMICSENGVLRTYVQCNVRDRDLVGFVEEAHRVVAERVTLPTGASIEWAGRFEHELRTRRTLFVVFPLMIALIFVVLRWTWRDLTHAALLLLAAPVRSPAA